MKVPVVMGEWRGKSLNLSVRLIELASLWLVRFFEEISVELARDSTLIEKSPVRAPVDALAVSPEFALLIFTERALKRDLSCRADAALLRVSSWLLSMPRSDTLASFSDFWLSSRVFGMASSSRSFWTMGSQSIPEAKPVSLKSEPII